MEAGLPVVLVVEDEPLVRMTMHDALSVEGFHVIEAANAIEAVTVLQARLDILCVVSDVAMPGEMNGVSLTWEVKRRWPNIAMILSSGRLMATAGEVPDGTRLLRKPYPLTDLVIAVTGAIIDRGRRAESSKDNVVPLPIRTRDNQHGRE